MEPTSVARPVMARPPERRFVQLEGDPLHTAESTVPAKTLRAFAVMPSLQAVVGGIAGYREQLRTPVIERVLPDGAACLIVNLGDVPDEGASPGLALAVVGARAAPAVVSLRGRIDGYSIRLRPGAMQALLGVPAGEVADRTVPLADLWPQAASLLARLHDTPGDAARVAILQQVLAEQWARQGACAPPAALQRMAGPARAPRDMARALGVGERRLQQLFHDHVGLPPRTWRRLMRLHGCLRLMRGRRLFRWADLAAEAGFYDQAHLVNEFQSLVGLTPSAFTGAASTGAAIAGSSKT